MKIILSRKGVDSSAGGFASPIFPDGTMVSIPIPDKRADVKYRDIKSTSGHRAIAKLVKNLSREKINGATRVHVDPDLDYASLPRDYNWRPLFGQCGAAQSHLQSLGVGSGDLFLFFGWFKQVESYRRRWRYVPGAADEHVIYGWMQVDSVELVDKIKLRNKCSWAHYHPHCIAPFSGSNVIYCAKRQLELSTIKSKSSGKISGAGTFREYSKALCLTNNGASRSEWRLPEWMHPKGRDSTLSYHSDLKRWRCEGSHALLRSAARGQEFVLDCDHYPEAKRWAHALLSCA